MNSDIASLLFVIFIMAVIVAMALSITLYGRRDAQRRLESMRRRYTRETTGTITKIARPQNTSRPTIITANYVVGGQSYTINEHLKYTAPGTSTGGFFITVKKVPALGEVVEGMQVRVVYQPDNPKYAMLADNEGVMEL